MDEKSDKIPEQGGYHITGKTSERGVFHVSYSFGSYQSGNMLIRRPPNTRKEDDDEKKNEPK